MKGDGGGCPLTTYYQRSDVVPVATLKLSRFYYINAAKPRPCQASFLISCLFGLTGSGTLKRVSAPRHCHHRWTSQSRQSYGETLTSLGTKKKERERREAFSSTGKLFHWLWITAEQPAGSRGATTRGRVQVQRLYFKTLDINNTFQNKRQFGGLPSTFVTYLVHRKLLWQWHTPMRVTWQVAVSSGFTSWIGWILFRWRVPWKTLPMDKPPPGH